MRARHLHVGSSGAFRKVINACRRPITPVVGGDLRLDLLFDGLQVALIHPDVMDAETRQERTIGVLESYLVHPAWGHLCDTGVRLALRYQLGATKVRDSTAPLCPWRMKRNMRGAVPAAARDRVLCRSSPLPPHALPAPIQLRRRRRGS